MEENIEHFWHILPYYFKKCKNATETQKMTCAVHGEGAVTEWTCQQWFAKFHGADFLPHDVPPLGRPAEADAIKSGH